MLPSHRPLEGLSSLASEFAPHGVLRVALNMGNPVLTGSRSSADRPAGVSIDMAREFGRRLGVDVALEPFDTPGRCVDALAREQADVGFLAVDALRAGSIHFSKPYVQIEGVYLVRAESTIQRLEQVDEDGVGIVVGTRSAYALHLSQTLKRAHMVEVATSEAVVDAMLADGRSVGAGVRQQLEADARRLGDCVRIVPGRFMVINQAMAIPKGRSATAKTSLDAFVAHLVESRFVEAAFARHGVEGVTLPQQTTEKNL